MSKIRDKKTDSKSQTEPDPTEHIRQTDLQDDRWQKKRENIRGAGRLIIGWGADIHLFVFTDCKNNQFQKKLVGQNVNIWIFAPPPPITDLPAPLENMYELESDQRRTLT